jgi:phage-related protein
VAEGISLNIDFETKEALAALKKIESETKKSTSQISSAFNAVKGVAVAAVAAIGSRELVRFFTEGVQVAREQEQALLRLTAQLKLTGSGGREAAEGIFSFAESLEETTLVEAEAIAGAFSLAKAFGLTNNEAKSLTSAALDLAAATGDSLEGAVAQLTNTYSGNIKQLGRLIPEVRTLSKEQLANGEAVRIVAQRFKGAAEDGVIPFDAALASLSRSLEDVGKSIGQGVLNAGGLTQLLKELSSLFGFLSGPSLTSAVQTTINTTITFGLSVIDTFASVVESVITFLSRAIEGIPRLLAVNLDIVAMGIKAIPLGIFQKLGNEVQGVADTVTNFADGFTRAEQERDKLAKNFQSLTFRIAKAGEVTTDFSKALVEGPQAGRKGITETAEEVKKLRDEALKFVNDLESKGLPALDRLDKELQDNVLKLEGYFKEGRINFDEFQRAITGLSASYAKERTKIVEEEAAKQKEAFKKTTEEIAKFVSPLASGLSQGAAGAAGFVTGTLSAGIDAILPGIGSAVKPLLDLFAQGPEQTKAAVKAFVEAIPEIIDAIAESIPVFVETLIDVLVNKGGAVRIGLAIAKAFYEAPLRIAGEIIGRWFGVELNKIVTGKNIVGAIAAGLGVVAQFISDAFADGARGIARLIAGIGDGIARGLNQFLTVLRQTFSNIGRTLFAGINQAFINSLRTFVGGLTTFFTSFLTSLQNLFAVVAEPFRQIFDVIVTILRGTVDAFRGIFTQFVPGIVAAFGNIIEAVGKLPNNLATAFTGAIDEIGKILKGAFSFLTEEPGWVKSFREAITGQKAKSAFSDPDNPIRRGVVGILTGGASEVLRVAGVPGFANGGVVGPDQRLALTRPDEMMLNPRQQSNLFRQLNSGTIGSDDALPLLAKIAALLEGGTTIETSINIGPDKLATAILNLNRRNARLGV